MTNRAENVVAVAPKPPKRSGRLGIALIVAIALACGLIAWWYAGLRNWFEPANFGIVEPGRIYRSAQISSHVILKTLEQNHVGVIVSLSGEPSPDADAEKSAAAELGIDRIYLGGLAGDGIGDPNVYPRAIERILQANRNGKAVLVHCQSGAQRTGGVIAAYRILVEGQPPAEAFAEMRKYGHDPKHNPNLIPFIEKHLPEWKQQLAQYEASVASRAATGPSEVCECCLAGELARRLPRIGRKRRASSPAKRILMPPPLSWWIP